MSTTLYRTETGATLSSRDVGSTLFLASGKDPGAELINCGTVMYVACIEESDNRDNWEQARADVELSSGTVMRFDKNTVAYLIDPKPEPEPAPDLYKSRSLLISRAMKVVQARIYSDIFPRESSAVADLEYAEDEFDAYVISFANALRRKS